jgi:hypothetical protein
MHFQAQDFLQKGLEKKFQLIFNSARLIHKKDYGKEKHA